MFSYKAAYAVGIVGLSFATPVYAGTDNRSALRPADSAVSFPYDGKTAKKPGKPGRGRPYGPGGDKGHDHASGKGHGHGQGGGHCEDHYRCHASPG